ncbi:LCP family protein [Streptomyces calidiresistens]|uniref:LCP family protein n=1 Tax=Streptomyces calidiresistens TaxID=1485586 RepID=UPI001E627243|nr:LCP family protein [Streptomyces calidiresistens]
MAERAEETAGERDPSGRTRRFRLPRRRWIVAVAVPLAVLLVAGVTAGTLWMRLDRNIGEVDIDTAPEADRPRDLPNGSLTILVLGSDARPGTGEPEDPDDGTAGGGGEDEERGGDDTGMTVNASDSEDDGDTGDDGDTADDGDDARADAAMIVHIAADRTTASVVSIPRDTLVHRPECVRPDGSTAPAEDRAMFNEAHAVGGPVCAVRTVEELTGIRMDHYVEVDFEGFEKIIDELGGVEVTVTRAVRDRHSGLDLAEGTHMLDGGDALALVRTRKTVGDGSDLGRIQLQHAFLRALMVRVADLNLFDSPRRVYRLADTTTSAITTDTGLSSVGRLASLGRTLQDIGPDGLEMVTLPVVYDEEDPNRVRPLEPEADRLWEALREDRPIPDDILERSPAEREAAAVVEDPENPEDPGSPESPGGDADGNAGDDDGANGGTGNAAPPAR